MTKITFTLDGREVEADPAETIWQVAQRHGTDRKSTRLNSSHRT